jgi:transketolase
MDGPVTFGQPELKVSSKECFNMPDNRDNIAQKAVNTIRFLAVDGVEKANSGHPGLPMGMADFAHVIFDRFLRHDPTTPDWPGRDRFVLSAGHGSMLVYAMLHLSGYDLPIDDLKAFRQLHSKTPGHPEHGVTTGIETTTGPLGQGFVNGVGMALATKLLGARLNTPDFSPVDNRIIALVSDGDLMEGITAEAASLAGHWNLGNLVYVYDDNKISIEGATDLTFTENVGQRFLAYGWHVQHVDGHDRCAIEEAMNKAINDPRPSLICARTHIAFGSPSKQDSSAAHGAPLGKDEVLATKKALGWPLEPTFLVPDDVREHYAARSEELIAQRKKWEQNFNHWRQNNPDKAALWDRFFDPETDNLLTQLIQAAGDQAEATRSLSGKVLQKAAERFPGLIGGSADLAPSNKTLVKKEDSLSGDNFSGRNIHFGIREHAMGSIMNGMALFQGIIPYGGTFLVFADYMRPAIRLASLMKLGAIYVFTHDSIFVGEDGPTHQPIEHLASLRCIPGLTVLRPADNLETAAAWTFALQQRKQPTALILTRQKLPILDRPAEFKPQDALKGAYVLVKEKDGNQAVVIATGSEVDPAAEAARKLGIRCVSMPSVEIFLDQESTYRQSVLPVGWKTAVVEASRDAGWYRWVGRDGLIIGMEGFGASAPAADLARHFGLNEKSIIAKLTEWVQA